MGENMTWQDLEGEKKVERNDANIVFMNDTFQETSYIRKVI